MLCVINEILKDIDTATLKELEARLKDVNDQLTATQTASANLSKDIRENPHDQYFDAQDNRHADGDELYGQSIRILQNRKSVLEDRITRLKKSLEFTERTLSSEYSYALV